jgi:hypothetical protein
VGFGEQAMATVQIKDEKKYTKAIGLLFSMGGFFWTRPTRQLVVNPMQEQALRNAGLLSKSNGARRNGKRKA